METMRVKKRNYDNSLRERRAAETRDKILRALSQLLANESITDLSVPKIADRAGVSEPTVYRYFPNREALLEGLDELWERDFKRPPSPKAIEEIPHHLEQLFRQFDEDRELILSFLKNPGATEARQLQRQRRLEDMRAVVEDAAPNLSREERDQAFGVFQLLASGDAWLHLGQHAGLQGDQAGRAVGTAMQTLIADLKSRNEIAALSTMSATGSDG